MLIAGLEYPRAAAIMGGLWSVFRVLYAVGYTDSSKKEGKGRFYGGLWPLPQFGLVALAGKVGWDLWNAHYA